MRAEKEWKRSRRARGITLPTRRRSTSSGAAGMQRDKNYEQVVTLGMRGDNDTPMSDTAQHRAAGENRRRSAADSERTVNPDLNKVPQVWALYKEVQGYYEKGMRVPDDVTLLWSDDNWGNLRRLPTPEERKRSGGAGIYYHFDYVGGPRSYKWLNTNYHHQNMGADESGAATMALTASGSSMSVT